MKAFEVAVVLTAVTGAFAGSLPNKIVGGNEAFKGEFPYQIHLEVTQVLWGFLKYTSFACGGSIISDQWIVTAAHCLGTLNPADYRVRVGQHDSSADESHATNHATVQIIRHPSYDAGTLINDIALIKVANKIQFTEHVKAISLPPNGYKPAAGTTAVVSGWGQSAVKGDVNSCYFKDVFTPAAILLQSVSVTVVSQQECASARCYYGLIADNMICAARKGKDSCQGDSGGPMAQKNADGTSTLTGVVSFGHGCALEGHPGVYTAVGRYVPWDNCRFVLK